MTTLKSYILDDAATVEYQRLDLMSKILDPWTRGYLRSLGVGPGWNCLELGSGNGSVTEWLCDAVGSAGSVTAIDIKPVLVDLIPAQNLTVRQADIRTAYFQLFFAEVRDRVLESGMIDAATFDAAAALLKDPEYWTQRWMMTAVWARKPVA